jgi:hypothetical protein
MTSKTDAKKAKFLGKKKAKRTKTSKAIVNTSKVANTTGQVFNPSRAPTVRKPAVKAEVKQSLIKQVCAVTDPFCPGAYGCRLPDGSGAQTLTTQTRQLVSIPVGASGGYAAAAFTPWGFMLDAPTSATIAWPAVLTSYNQTNGSSVFYANAQLARVVSFGVILRSACNTTNAQGTVIVGEASNIPFSGSGTIGDFLLQKVQSSTLFAGAEVCWKVSPSNSTLAKEFLLQATVNSTSSFSSIAGWPTLVVEVIGGPTAGVNVITAEVFVNWEWQLNQDNSMVPMLPAPKAPNPTVVKLADKVNASGGGGHEGGTSVTEKIITTLASEAVSFLGEVDWMEFLMGALMFL